MKAASSTSSLSIRPASAADVPAILQMVRELAAYENLLDEVTATPSRMREALFGASPHAHAILAEHGGEPVGMAVFFFNFSTFRAQPGLYLEDLYVKKAFRRRGYGQRMLRYLAEVAVQKGCGRLEWAVLDWNLPAVRFYEKMGAKVLKEWRICRVSGESLPALASLPTETTASTP